jgi:cyclohexanecarboxylate-CoA ligase
MQGPLVSEERIALERRRGIWPDRVITDYLDRWLAEKPDAIAAICYRTEGAVTKQLTWRDLAENVVALARGLRALGVRKGDVVSFQLPNWWEFIVIHLACVRIGAVSNPLMPIFRQREMAFMVKHAESKVLITPTCFRGFDHGALALDLKHDLSSLEHVFLIGGEGEYSLDALGRAGENKGAAESGTTLGPNDVMQLLFTSGTTGEPKGVLHTSNTLIGTILKFIERMQLTAADVVFMPSPMAHQAGFAYGLTLAILLGAPLLLMDIWNPARAAELMESHRATYTFGATPFLSDLANLPGVESRDLSAFRLFVTSGAPIPPALVQEAQAKLRARIVASWGMTECCSVTTTFPSGYKADESDGCAVPGAEVRIVDLLGNELPRGQTGTLKFRGASTFVGYLKRPELYGVDEQGWFNSGDIARMDEEGYIRICGREKDIIIRGGENVPVLEIENAMYRIPQISAVAIVAMPDARMGERACAFVTLQPGAHLTSEDMQEFLAAEGVSKHFWPERLEIIERMPLTPIGKIQKFVLREMAKNLVSVPRNEQVSKASQC